MNAYFQKCITFGRAAEGLRADFQAQLSLLQREIGFEYVRFHGLFHDDMAVYSEDENGEPIFWFGYVDRLIDFLLSKGLKPFLELGFMPMPLATVPDTVFWWHANGCPPKDYSKWHKLVLETVRHLTERYGVSEVSTWYFEVWNEPNLDSFWRGTQAEYFRLYAETVDAVKSVHASYRVGGPSTSGADFREGLSYLRAFLDFCEKQKLPVDFVSAHPYPTYWPLDTAGNEQMGYMSKESTIAQLSHIREIVDTSAFPQAEIHLTEWNSSPSPRDLIHDTPFMAPFILYNITQNFGKVDSLAFWTFTDVFEENGPGTQPFHGGFGLMNADGIKKPSYWAYWMLSKLGSQAVCGGDSYFVTREGAEYQILLWNYCYYTEEFAKGDRRALTLTDRDGVFETKAQTVQLSLPLKGNYTQTVYTLDEETSALHNWIRLGAPQYPSNAQIRLLKAKSRPKKTSSNMVSPEICVTLKPHEVKLLLLRPSEDT